MGCKEGMVSIDTPKAFPRPQAYAVIVILNNCGHHTDPQAFQRQQVLMRSQFFFLNKMWSSHKPFEFFNTSSVNTVTVFERKMWSQ